MLLINRLKGCMYLVRLRSYEKLGGAYPLYKHTRVHVCVHTHLFRPVAFKHILSPK